ncbi:3'-5' exoribonuclease YhaM family protein [Desulfobaculum bizertense]|uniref:3'-5' exoribonuclease n=1 Tax=Desulfobaculum bizertense DSM 18034 TaxID=1121442 RepID=A0A1T4VF43_9BACT|nr:HD domain-containing protein [Desulfobaculum bizertense]UIJ37715.1 HD domain-containing protein [Desulfobaculum bizertense]SKA63604.1 3'-5' exoribonuclease [Desulfobaculum bizertense DSM 18034]
MIRKQTFVRDLAPGRNIDDVFVVVEARQAQAKNGPFWALTLGDNSGEVPARIFYPMSQSYPQLSSGTALRVMGQVQTYRDEPQIIVDSVQELDPAAEGLRLGDFVPSSKREPEDMLADIERLCKKHLGYRPWRTLCRKVLTDPQIKPKIIAAPGAVSMHHAYAGGLIEHTLGVCRLCMAYADLYPHLDRQVLLAGAIFHDLGKAWEYSAGLARERTDIGKLLGHIQIGLQKLEPFLERATDLDDDLKTHLRHLILSHHGALEFGSPTLPQTAEALALHFADNMDAKMNTIEVATEDIAAGETGWSQYLRALSRSVYQPRHTPAPRPDNEKEEANQLCLLPLKG